MPERPRRPDVLRNLTRIDISVGEGKREAHGWLFRRQWKKKSLSKFFPDSKHGGKDKALEAAKLFRDEMELKYPPLQYISRMTSRNVSGIVGVRKVLKKKRRGDHTYAYYAWEASWTTDSGERKKRSFSIKRHGEAEALRLAIEAREEGLAQRTGATQRKFDWGEHPLEELVQIVETTKSSDVKGRALEELVFHLFESSSNFSVSKIRSITETEEIDLVILNNSNDPRFKKESAILLVECKNWSGKCGKNEFVLFKEKIENRSNRCSLGFLISWNGFATTVTKEMLRGSREETLVVSLDGKDIKRAIQENDFEKILGEAWDRAVMT